MSACWAAFDAATACASEPSLSHPPMLCPLHPLMHAEVDGKLSPAALRGSRFGECLLEAALPGGWGLAAAFSPSGDCLAVASQGSQVTLLHGIDLQDPASLDVASVDAAGCLQHLALPGLLPLKCLAFLSDGVVAGGGFDCCPVLCTRQENGQWQFARSLQGEWELRHARPAVVGLVVGCPLVQLATAVLAAR